MAEKNYLPLRLWILISGIVFASLFVLTQDLKIDGIDDQKRKILNVSRLEQKSENPRIILIGSSLLGFALPTERTIEEKLEEEGVKFKIDRFVTYGIRPEYFTTIFDEILQSKPSIIIISANMFLLDDDKFFDFKKREENFQHNIHLSHDQVTQGYDDFPKSTWGYKLNTGTYSYPILVSGFSAAFRNKSQNDVDDLFRNLTNPKIGVSHKIKLYLPLIRAAQKSGTRIVFMDMGRSKPVNDYLSTDARKAIDESLTNLATITNSEIWRFPVALPEDHYCDLLHLNEKGQKVFTEWFIDRLKQNSK